MTVQRAKAKDFVFKAPPSKAHSLRAILLASLAEGSSKIEKPLLAEDQRHLIDALKRLGIKIEEKEDNSLTIEGSGGCFSPLKNAVDVGESGVAMNTLIALASLIPGSIAIGGAPGLLARPVGELVDALRGLGADIEYLDREGYPPLKVHSSVLNGGEARLSGARTSQYFSALTLASPLAQNNTTLICTDELSEKPYFDITLDIMHRFGVEASHTDYQKVYIPAKQQYRAQNLRIEGDWSSASFFLLAAAILAVTGHIEGLNPESKQGDRLFADYLIKMGANLTWEKDILKVKGGPLSPIEVDMGDTPDLVPPLAIAAAFAEGRSYLHNVERLRYKESNRLEAISQGLARLGIKSSFDTSLVIEGNPKHLYAEAEKRRARGEILSIASWNDHRIAMSFAMAGLALGNIAIEEPESVAKSFPNFWEELAIF